MALGDCFRLKPKMNMTVDQFKVWLMQFDLDHDGQISRGELEEALGSLDMWFRWWKARQIMKVADSDGDGYINDSKEIEKLVNYAQRHFKMKITESGC